jgi:aminopeptidase N
MRTDTPPMIRLKDYRPSHYLIETVHLTVVLDAKRTRVTSKLKLRPNQASKGRSASLRLDGSNLELVTVMQRVIRLTMRR